MITEAHGIPLAVSLTGGNRNDVTQLLPLIEAIPPIRGRRGRPRRRPDALYADRGYDHDKYRKLVRDRGIIPFIARRGVEHGSGVEQSFALLHWFRRLRIRWEIRDDIYGRDRPASMMSPMGEAPALGTLADNTKRHSRIRSDLPKQLRSDAVE